MKAMNGFQRREGTQPPTFLPGQPFAGNFLALEARRGPKSHHNLGNPGNVG